MTDAVAEPEEGAKGGKRGVILWVILAVFGAGVGFAAVHFGLVPVGAAPAPAAETGKKAEQAKAVEALPESPAPGAFVPIEPITVSLIGDRRIRQLRFRAQLEVEPGEVEEVTRIMPRIIDVLNGYLRALEPADLSEPAILVRLRAQMLRRVNIVAGNGRVRDLLIMEFVLN